MKMTVGVAALAFVLLSACGDKSQETGDLTPESADEATDGDGANCREEEPCDDGDPCTWPDKCVAGQCVGGTEGAECPEFPCAEGGCDGQGGCLAPAVTGGWCLVDDLCLEAGESAAGQACLVCDPEVSSTALIEAETGTTCEDGNVCTENDFCDSGDCLPGSPPTCADGVQCTADACDPVEGCRHDPDHEQCNDYNPCTQDACDPTSDEDGGCTNVPDDSLPCADKDVCTTNDHCEKGICVHDEEPLDCDDLNECTDESCHSSYGCLYVFNENPCNDNASCTIEDKCHYGKCVGEELWYGGCPACELEFSDQVAKIVGLRVGDGGHPGEALNIDNDLKSCSPSFDCELGLDNSLTIAGDFIDETISENLVNKENPLIFTAELTDPTFDGGEFVMTIYYATLSDTNLECDFMTEKCLYDVSSLNFDPLCNSQVTFKNASVEEGVLTAGGSGYIFPFKMSFVNGEKAETVLYSARVKADVELDAEDNVLSLKGVMGGAITQQNLVALIMAIPEQYMPIPKEDIIGLVEAMPQDIDLNGDGTMDASSIALVFETIPAVLAPYYY